MSTLKTKRTALVTGGSSGIGKACAVALLDAGHSVMIADIHTERTKAAALELGCSFVVADLTKRADCQHVVSESVKELGGLDILINSAGFQHIDSISDFPEDTWDNMLAVLLTAPFLLTKYAWEHLKRSGHGRIIHIGSIHSLTASPYKAAYVSAKHGLLGLMRVAALEGGEHGITCNTVAPAYVRTPLVEQQIKDQARTRGISEVEVEERVFLENLAIKKLLEPEDVASYALYLASEEAWGITGSTATLDLGWTAR